MLSTLDVAQRDKSWLQTDASFYLWRTDTKYTIICSGCFVVSSVDSLKVFFFFFFG